MLCEEKQDDLVECPYNKLHRMHRKRIQPHIVKCRQSYPEAELIKCPFNGTHMIPEPEFTYHVANCPDKALITQYKYTQLPTKTEEEKRQQVVVECEENWDEVETEDYSPTIYATKASVLRLGTNHVVPLARKEFRKTERKRLGEEVSDDEDDKSKVFKDLDCMIKQEARKNEWYEDTKGASTSKITIKRRESYYEPQESIRTHKRPIKLERRDSEQDGSKRIKQEEAYPLDDDPYYRSNNLDSYESRIGWNNNVASARGAYRRYYK